MDLGSILKLAAMAAIVIGSGGTAAPAMAAAGAGEAAGAAGAGGAAGAAGAGGAAGGGSFLSSLFGSSSAAPAMSLPASSATPGIANASGDFLSSVGLPGYGAGGATPAGNAEAAPGTDWMGMLKQGGQLMQAMGKGQQKPPTQPVQPSPSPTTTASPAPPVNFGSGSSSGDDPYAGALQRLLREHSESSLGGGY